MPSFRGGGAERVMVELARGLVGLGISVDLVVAQREGPNLMQRPPAATIVDLGAKRVLLALPALVRYLRDVAPDAMLSALPHTNVIAVAARRLARSRTRLVVAEHTTASLSAMHSGSARGRALPVFMKFAYPRADAVVAVSAGVADDLARLIRLDRRRITVIHNPVTVPRLFELAVEPVDHPWFGGQQIPVILGVGRLTAAKDFVTLIRAFELVRKVRPVRLMILGEGAERPRLEALIRDLQLEADVALPGFVENPYKYMQKASVFVLSSRWEGFGNVLVEAMACGAPVISTDCPNGPREILENGKHGRLVPVGDMAALSQAIVDQLDHPPPRRGSTERAMDFSLDAAIDRYRSILSV